MKFQSSEDQVITPDELENIWKKIESVLDIDSDSIVKKYHRTPDRATYVLKDRVVKAEINLRNEFLERHQSLDSELRILNKIDDLCLAPKILDICSDADFTAITLKRVDGVLLDEMSIDIIKLFEINIKMIRSVLKLSRRGVVHGDFVPHNIIYGSNKRIYLIDFGHAYETSFAKALYRNVLMRHIAHPGFNRPYSVTFVRLVEFSLPVWAKGLYRSILKIGEYKKID